jgi:phosphatidylinositol-3,4,5-trisphosphate 3-phosphatase/dual-specificity protein phosphatase PTEN
MEFAPPPAAGSACVQLLQDWGSIEAVCPLCKKPFPEVTPGESTGMCEEATHLMHCTQLAAEKVDAMVSQEVFVAKPAPVVPTAPPEKTKDRAIAAMRSLVSQKKVRYQQDGFDLDLTYITPKIIAMGFPSHGREAYFRNPIDEVERFFDTKHPNHYRIYNLCSEREYEGEHRFGGRFKRFPFDDHNAPCPIRLIPDLCRDVREFLEADEENVVAIHCKAGKGRTGLMIACLLMLIDPSLRNPTEALAFFGDMRTADGKGVTIPSQKRYVSYWDMMLRDFAGKDPPPRTLCLELVKIHTLIKPSGFCDVYFHIYERGKLKIDSKKYFPNVRSQIKGENFEFDFPVTNAMMQLTGDIKFVFFQQNRVLKDDEMFHFWFNTSLCHSDQETIPKSQLDKAFKDKKHSDFTQDLAVTLYFKPLTMSGASANSFAAGGGGASFAGPGDKAGQGDGKSGKGIFSRLFK